MDFFGKDFQDFSNTPAYSKYDKSPKKVGTKYDSNSIFDKKDDFDDLLDGLLEKQSVKKSRRNNMEPYSSQNLGTTAFDTFNNKNTNKAFGNTESAINYEKGLSKGGNKGSKKSILDDLMSYQEDNKSYKSGATARRDNKNSQNLNFMKKEQKDNQPFTPAVSMRSNMRPPLKKRAQSRQASIFNDDKSISKINDNYASVDDLDIVSITPKLPRRNPSQQKNRQNTQNKQVRFQLSPSKEKPTPKSLIDEKQPMKPMIQEKIIQKIIHVKEQNKEVMKRHEQQLKILKDSYERQINSLKENYQRALEDERKNRKKLIKQYDQNLDRERLKWQKLLRSQTQRIKQFYEWQQKKKNQSYDLQISKLKKLLQTLSKNHLNAQSDRKTRDADEQKHQFHLKQKQLERQKERIDQEKTILQNRKKQLQNDQFQFDMYRKKEEEKMTLERKKLWDQETHQRQRQIETKRDIMAEKQSLAANMVNNQISLNQARENLRLENEKLNMERQLFSQQKIEFQKINNKILQDLKQKQKQIETQKQTLSQLQIQLYQKINTVELMGVQKSIQNKSPQTTLLLNTLKRTGNKTSLNQTKYLKQNMRDRSNTQLTNKINSTKNRYNEMQIIARKNAWHKAQVDSSWNIEPKVHLQNYIEKLGRNKAKSQYV